MNKKGIFGALLVLLMLSGCSLPPITSTLPTITQPVEISTGGSVVNVEILDDGVSVDSVVAIGNFHAGARAEAIYRIHNASSKEVTPQIYPNWNWDVANYTANGMSDEFQKTWAGKTVKAPDYVKGWIEIPELTSIMPGDTTDFIVALVMPKDAEKPADKIGFVIEVAAKTKGMMQTAVGSWWLVGLR